MKTFKKESEFQKYFINAVKQEIPDCLFLKNDANYMNGFPDWTMFCKKGYAIFECKIKEDAHKQPLQDFYINKFKNFSEKNEKIYASFVYPENFEEVLNDIKKIFK